MSYFSVRQRHPFLAALFLCLASAAFAQTPPITPDIPKTFTAPRDGYDYVKRVEMIPMRDGVKLYTVIVIPNGAKGAPMLLTRTPYNAAARATRANSTRMLATLPQGDELFVADGYIRIFQDVRGKYGSEGDYVMTRPLKGPLNPTNVDHSTDAYDTIEWLVKNVPESNGRVGMLGSSYEGFTVVMALVNPHPALKVAAPMSPMVDGWMGDDWFHFGAFRQTNFDYYTGQTSAQGGGGDIVRRGYDDYENFRRAGSAGDFAKAAGLDQLPWYRKTVEHPAYDSFWSDQALDKTMAAQPLTVPTMWIQGIWDQEDMWGAIHSYLAVEPKDTANTMNYLVMGPWRHSGVNYDGSTLGPLKLDGDTALQFRRDVLKPFFDQYLKEGAPKAATPPVFIYNTGENHWDRLQKWPLACESGCAATSKPLYLAANSGLSFSAPATGSANAYDEYVSDPAKPVSYLPRPVRFADAERWRRWLVTDQRTVADRPDVLTYHDAGADGAGPCQRGTAGEPGGGHERDGHRLGGETDRRLSGRSAEPARDGRLSAGGFDGHFPRPLPREFRDAKGHHAERAASLPLHPADDESRLPARPPRDDPGAIELVPSLRSQPADIRAEHLLCQAGGLQEGDAAHLSRELREPAGARQVIQPVAESARHGSHGDSLQTRWHDEHDEGCRWLPGQRSYHRALRVIVPVAMIREIVKACCAGV